MTKQQAFQIFTTEYYGDKHKLKRAVANDYYAVQLEWSFFTDMLCRNGDITTKQYSTWLTPFKIELHDMNYRRYVERQEELTWYT